MNEDKMYEMLMSIMQDLAVVKSKLDTLEEITDLIEDENENLLFSIISPEGS